jgi:HEAT repeat protein
MIKAIAPHLALTLLLSSAAACQDSDTPPDRVSQEITAAASNEAPLAADSIKAAMPQLSPDELTQLIGTLDPVKARNGELRFSDARLDTPAAAPILIQRLRQSRDSEATRKALILALPRTQGDYAADALALLNVESSDDLRAALVDAMRLANDDVSALEGLKLGLSDRSSTVRARAAFNIGRRADGQALTDDLLAVLGDSDSAVQAASARALGQLGASHAFDALLPLLSSPDADTRLESLRALGRVDAERAAKLELSSLASDSDERIATAVAKVKAQAY